MPIQSLVFNRRYWSASGAERWAKKHGFHTDYGIDTAAAGSIRIRQRPPPESPYVRYYTTSVWSHETNKPVQLVVYEFDSPDKFVYNLPFSTETGKRTAAKYLKGTVLPSATRAPPVPPGPPPGPPGPPPGPTPGGIASLARAGMGPPGALPTPRSFSGAPKTSSLLDYYSGLLPSTTPFTASKPGATSAKKFIGPMTMTEYMLSRAGP